MKKIHLNLYVDENLVNKAKKHGLNLSRFVENQMSGYFNFIEQKQNKFTPYNIEEDKGKNQSSQNYPSNNKSNNILSHSCSVSCLVRADRSVGRLLPSQGRGRGFKSRSVH